MKRKNLCVSVLALFFALGCVFSPKIFSQDLPKSEEEKPSPSLEYEKCYSYDKSAPFNLKISSQDFKGGYTLYNIKFESSHRIKIPALLMVPAEEEEEEETGIESEYPIIFFMHWHASDKSMAPMLLETWVKDLSVAVIAIDGVFRGDRSEEKDREYINLRCNPPQRGWEEICKERNFECTPANAYASADNLQQQVIDMLRTFDCIRSDEFHQKFPCIDQQRIGFVGISLGAVSGAIAVALTGGVTSACFVDGGGSFEEMFTYSTYGAIVKIRRFVEKEIEEQNIHVKKIFGHLDAIAYTEKLKKSATYIVLLNGDKDSIMPPETISALQRSLDTHAYASPEIDVYEDIWSISPEKEGIESYADRYETIDEIIDFVGPVTYTAEETVGPFGTFKTKLAHIDWEKEPRIALWYRADHMSIAADAIDDAEYFFYKTLLEEE